MSRELHGVTFPAWRNGDFIALMEVLLVLGRWIAHGVGWRLKGTEFAPGWRGSDELNAMCHQMMLTPTPELIDLVSDGIQIVDGRLEAFSEASSEPFLVLESIRGDEWDVFAIDEEVLRVIRETFDGVREIPS